MKAQIKKFSNFVNAKSTALAVSTTALLATNAYAGPLADAVTSEVTDFKSDLYAVGAIVIGLALVGVGVGMVIHMLNRAR